MIELQHIIDSKREFLSRETYSRTPINYGEGMANDQKDRFIQYLAEQHQEDELTKRAMELVLEDFMAQMKELKEQVSFMQSKQSDLENRLSEEHKLCKSAERKAKSLQEKLDFANQERFDDRRQRINPKAKNSASDRQKEKDDYDGTDDTLRTDSVDKDASRNEPALPKKERDLSNRPDGYKTMGVAVEAIEYPSDLTKVPGRIIERRMVRVFSFRTFLTEECFEMVHYAEPGKKPKWGYFPSEGHPQVITKFEGTKSTSEFLQAIAYEVYVKNVTFGLLHRWLTDMGITIVFIGDELKSTQFKDTIHQVCMSHANNKFVKAGNQGGEPVAERFSNLLKWFFSKEHIYDEAGLTPKERLRERQSLETKAHLIELRSLLDSELSKDAEYRSQYYTEALNYLNRFWKEIFAYLDDGELPIDNNFAERTIRKLTTQRNNSLHYGSDAGAEMAVTYHSVIGTVKLHGSSVWNFIGTFFKNIFNGCRDYVNMVPGKITLATSQC